MTTLNLKAFVQGHSIDRTATVILKNRNGEVVAELASAIDTNGDLYVSHSETIVEPVRIGLKGNSFLEVVSSAFITPVNGEIRYDFSIDIAQALGDNQIEISEGVWAIPNGDFNQDGSIDASDMSLFENNENNEQDEMTGEELATNIFNSVYAKL